MRKNEIKDNKEMVLFENNKIRRQMYNGEWNYAIADIIEILTDSKDPNAYWRKLKERLNKEGNESVTNCHELKISSKKDGKKYKTDCANRETIFRLIQSIPSPNAEPFKLWFARLAEERIQEIIDPSLAIERARQTYLKKGYDEEWTNTRIKGIDARHNLTNEWKSRGANTTDYAILTDEISKGTFGITTQQHKDIKSLDRQNLRDNMSAMELALMTLAEVTTTEIHKTNNSQGVDELQSDAQKGGGIAGVTRRNIEKQLGKPVVTSKNANDFRKNKRLNNNNKLV
ncbi:MAG: Bro-N domain-containing protein [Clostridia bacterium]|nr:Bro-N domain-containing protein [Clostridia bacterium]